MILIVQIALFIMTLLGVGIIVLSKNVVHAAYALALVLVSLAGIYVMLNSELLAVVQILLYAGGVVILLVFGVMLTNRLRNGKLLTHSGNTFVAALISVSVFASLLYLIDKIPLMSLGNSEAGNQIGQLGVSFLTDHLVAFELIAFILLVALVGASYLAKMSSDE
ncbi:MAG: NADH-quinone oxidoreductase subunit J [Cyclobacteriaceae bacterium]